MVFWRSGIGVGLKGSVGFREKDIGRMAQPSEEIIGSLEGTQMFAGAPLYSQNLPAAGKEPSC